MIVHCKFNLFVTCSAIFYIDFSFSLKFVYCFQFQFQYMSPVSQFTYWSNSEYWSQKGTQNGNIHSMKLNVYAVKQSVSHLSFILSCRINAPGEQVGVFIEYYENPNTSKVEKFNSPYLFGW